MIGDNWPVRDVFRYVRGLLRWGSVVAPSLSDGTGRVDVEAVVQSRPRGFADTRIYTLIVYHCDVVLQ